MTLDLPKAHVVSTSPSQSCLHEGRQHSREYPASNTGLCLLFDHPAHADQLVGHELHFQAGNNVGRILEPEFVSCVDDLGRFLEVLHCRDKKVLKPARRCQYSTPQRCKTYGCVWFSPSTSIGPISAPWSKFRLKLPEQQSATVACVEPPSPGA